MIIGLVGKPSAGKSTFFKAATLAEVEIANYPFTTIKPNSGVGYVRVECAEKNFGVKCNPRTGYCLEGQRFVPVEVIDVAGLVPEAHLGKGRGNQFLDDLRQAHVLIHVIDISGSLNAHGEPVESGSYDPAKDIQFLETELDMWYLGIIKRHWDKFARTVQQEKQNVAKALAELLSTFRVKEEMITDAINIMQLNKDNVISWTDDDLKKLATELRKKTKPMVIAANKIDVPGAKEKLDKVREQFPDLKIIPCSAESELALKEAAKHGIIDYIPGNTDFTIKDDSKLNEKQKKALEFIRINILEKNQEYGTGVQHVLNTAVLDLLGYFPVFPGGVNKLEDQHGNVLPDCFLLPPDSTALDFAYTLHTDFGRNFIRAIDVKTKKTVGKEHKLRQGDVVEIIAGK
ncbi:redox-regulated ATPase YchF [Candidatus Woesearchaeota archaeon]|nr:redox-regulated ATPase YchF [Candidatus Woesearchaeota archaeon]